MSECRAWRFVKHRSYWTARSPSFERDGIVIIGDTREQVVDRILALEFALERGRDGRGGMIH